MNKYCRLTKTYIWASLMMQQAHVSIAIKVDNRWNYCVGYWICTNSSHQRYTSLSCYSQSDLQSWDSYSSKYYTWHTFVGWWVLYLKLAAFLIAECYSKTFVTYTFEQRTEVKQNRKRKVNGKYHFSNAFWKRRWSIKMAEVPDEN